jgi:hypothetical protein
MYSSVMCLTNTGFVHKLPVLCYAVTTTSVSCGKQVYCQAWVPLPVALYVYWRIQTAAIGIPMLMYSIVVPFMCTPCTMPAEAPLLAIVQVSILVCSMCAFVSN